MRLKICNIFEGAGVWVGFSRVQTTAEAIAALMLASFTSAFSITVVDSILVTRTHGQSLDFAASLQSFCWGLQVSSSATLDPVIITAASSAYRESCASQQPCTVFLHKFLSHCKVYLISR